MHNYIFTYKGDNYITTFETGHTRPCEKITNIPQHIMPKLLKDLTNPIYIEVEDVSWDKWKDMHVKGTVVLEGIPFYIDTLDKQSPVSPIVAHAENPIQSVESFVKALSLPQETPLESSAQEVVTVDIAMTPQNASSAVPEDTTLTDIEVEEPFLGNDHVNDPDVLHLDRIPGIDYEHETPISCAPKLESEEEPSGKVRVEDHWEILDSLPQEVFNVIEEWIETIPDKDRLLEDGDLFCIENDWHWIDGYYIIDNTKLLIRYLHSDAYEIDFLCIPYELVMRRRNHGE